MKVFVITTGEYSDYRIHSIWSTEERAEEVSARVSDSNGVDEWDVDQFADLNPNRKSWSFYFDKSGNLIEERERSVDPMDENKTELDFANHKWFQNAELHIFIKVVSDDRNRAFKIATDKRAEFLAQQSHI